MKREKINFEHELRRINLIKRYAGYTETALDNEGRLDLARLLRTHPGDIRKHIKAELRKDLDGQVG